ncbi:MAG TPA: DUF1007 family protein [Stellaceae bacterium]|nr:DUF1007 family protein [Stellaceae bacterium]
MAGFSIARGPCTVAAVVAAAVGGAPMSAQAHPHIFIKQSVVALFDQSALTGFRLTWRFDSMYSSMMRADFVSTKSGPLTPADVKNLHDKSFADLKDVHYFTTVTFNGKPLPLDTPTNFSATADGGNIAYTFDIPVRPDPHDLRPENVVAITVFDPSYYVYYELASDNPVAVTGGTGLKAACGASVVWRDSIGWGRVHSDLVTCTYLSPR